MFRYRGYVYDFESGFYYLQSRYYDPNTGRFLNGDDIAYLGAGYNHSAFNLYVYCTNNPIKYIDSQGRWPENNYPIYGGDSYEISWWNSEGVWNNWTGNISKQTRQYRNGSSATFYLGYFEFGLWNYKQGGVEVFKLKFEYGNFEYNGLCKTIPFKVGVTTVSLDTYLGFNKEQQGIKFEAYIVKVGGEFGGIGIGIVVGGVDLGVHFDDNKISVGLGKFEISLDRDEYNKFCEKIKKRFK